MTESNFINSGQKFYWIWSWWYANVILNSEGINYLFISGWTYGLGFRQFSHRVKSDETRTHAYAYLQRQIRCCKSSHTKHVFNQIWYFKSTIKLIAQIEIVLWKYSISWLLIFHPKKIVKILRWIMQNELHIIKNNSPYFKLVMRIHSKYY